MNINKYIEQAYTFFTSLAKEVVKELRTDNKDVTTGLVEAKKAIVDINTEVASEVLQVNHRLLEVIQAIEDKPVVESVNISNLDELTQGIEGIIDTLKTELGKIDKEIVVKNDLSQLTALFKSGEDKKDLVKALKRIEDGVKEEKPDYTLILDDIATLVEKIKPEVDLSGVLDLLSQVAVGVNQEQVDHLAKYAKYDRLKVELSDAQIKKMAANVTVASGGGSGLTKNANGTPVNPATEETMSTQPAFYHNASDVPGDGVGRQITATSIPTKKGVLIKAANENTWDIYVGNNSEIGAGYGTSNSGFQLSAGESLMIEVDNVNKVYLVSAQGGNYYWLTV